MAIARGDTSSTSGNSVSSLTFAHDVAGSDTFLLVGVNGEEPNASNGDLVVTGITYAGVAMTKIDGLSAVGATDTDRSELWYLIAPTTGTNNVVITFTGAVAGAIGMAVTYTGVSQTAPQASSSASNTSSSAETASVTTLTSNAVVVAVGCNGSTANTFTLDSGTELFNITDGGGIVEGGMAEKTQASPGSVTISWTLGAASRWAEVIVALGEAGPTTSTSRTTSTSTTSTSSSTSTTSTSSSTTQSITTSTSTSTTSTSSSTSTSTSKTTSTSMTTTSTSTSTTSTSTTSTSSSTSSSSTSITIPYGFVINRLRQL